MDMRSEIKKLARIEEGQYPFLSFYLNTTWNDEQQRERIRLFTKNQLKKGYGQFKGPDPEGWQKAYTEDQQRIEKYVGGLVRQAYNEETGNLSVPCPRYKGETKRIDLAEEMMKLTLRQDGEVKWAEENLILKENDGVGAALRFR